MKNMSLCSVVILSFALYIAKIMKACVLKPVCLLKKILYYLFQLDICIMCLPSSKNLSGLKTSGSFQYC